ncbi:SDR family NAD(P)-dependent oxidoreductase [Metabacillus sp. RGM 3146]|uniref:SDR family NAD(P)-dependent oxidoreductase n=1 Tax=Metabacillus sp. RGM 3146 TaxID=3401092 RepID=UPI003B98F320
MDLQLTGKRVLITGSTAGIGKGTAEQFLKEGAEVLVNGRSEERVGQIVEDLSKYGKVEGIAADLRIDLIPALRPWPKRFFV